MPVLASPAWILSRLGVLAATLLEHGRLPGKAAQIDLGGHAVQRQLGRKRIELRMVVVDVGNVQSQGLKVGSSPPPQAVSTRPQLSKAAPIRPRMELECMEGVLFMGAVAQRGAVCLACVTTA